MAAAAIRVARRAGARQVDHRSSAACRRAQADRAVQLAVEGALLGSYRFVKYRNDEAKKADPIATVKITTERGKRAARRASRPPLRRQTMKAAIERAEQVAARGQPRARPHQRARRRRHADALAADAQAIAKKHKGTVTVTVLDAEGVRRSSAWACSSPSARAPTRSRASST